MKDTKELHEQPISSDKGLTGSKQGFHPIRHNRHYKCRQKKIILNQSEGEDKQDKMLHPVDCISCLQYHHS